jgi:NADH:ubiquinone oxidoreductase subunit
VHPNSRHSTSECREIIKLAKRVSEQREQTSKDGSPPRCRPGKERVDDGDVATGERDLGYQSPEQVLKDILIGDSDSGDDTDHRKKLYVMYDGSWEPSQMPGIPREVIEHHLKIHPDAKPVSQKPWRQSVERQDFIRKEVRKLLDAGFIEEVHHPVWLANLVIVPKANGKLQMCIDYTSLNKACPKDPYPLPRIDQIMDSTSRCDLLSFLDAYSGFHQI